MEKIRKTIDTYRMLSGNDHVLVGLSGGPDSVCLTVLLDELKTQLKLKVSAVYLDHGLRPDEVKKEEEFCRKFCEGRGIGFSVKQLPVKTYAHERSMNVQEAARELRYAVLDELLQASGADKIALGHNADDQAETVLMRLFRGSGRKGLSGIPPVRGKIIRPLIEAGRADIELFLRDTAKQDFMVDSSNLKDDYFRNWLRSNIMNEVKKKNPSVVEDICRSVDIVREEDEYLELTVTKTLMRMISRKSDTSIELFVTPLQTLEKPLLRRVLRRAVDATGSLRGISLTHIEDIMKLIKRGKAGDRIDLPRDVRVIKDYSILKITTDKKVAIAGYELESGDEINIPETGFVISSSIENADGAQDNGRFNIVLDAERIRFPLTVRSRARGDHFYPLGFGRKKKLQDFFVDEKISRDKRDEVPIVVSGNDIIWVAGLRADHRYRVTEATTKVLRLKMDKINAKNA